MPWWALRKGAQEWSNHLIVMEYLEAGNGIEPMYTALQSVAASLFPP